MSRGSNPGRQVCSSPKYSNSVGTGMGAVCPGAKRLVRESEHAPPSSTEVKNTWGYTSTSLIRRHGVRSGKSAVVYQ